MPRDRFATYAWSVLGVNLLVILWGAYVRATGSGAGCGSHWPTCNGEIVPRSPSTATLIELTHRLTSGIALLLVAALLVWAWRAFPPAHRVRHGALWTMIFMLGEAAIGAGIVLFELVADNASMARALWMGVHLGNTFLLLGALTLTAWWGEGGAPVALAGRGRQLWLPAGVLAATVVMAASGAIAALGDTLFPASSLGEAIRQDLSPTSHVLIQLRASHPLLAVLVCVLLLYYIGAVRRQAPAPETKRFANLLNLAIFVQLGAGAVNILLLAPIWMQLVHLLLADTLWILLVLTCASALSKPAPRSEPAG